jgi:hypothetical protein
MAIHSFRVGTTPTILIIVAEVRFGVSLSKTIDSERATVRVVRVCRSDNGDADRDHARNGEDERRTKLKHQ